MSLRILPRIQGMTVFADFAALGRRLERVRGRLEKRDEVARFLRGLAPEEIATAVAFLAARAFPASDPRVLGVRWLPRDAGGGAEGAPLTLLDVAGASADVAVATGSGLRRTPNEPLARLGAPASAFKRDFLNRYRDGPSRSSTSATARASSCTVRAIGCRCGRGACRTSRAVCPTSWRSRATTSRASRSSSTARWWRSTRPDGRCRSRN